MDWQETWRIHISLLSWHQVFLNKRHSTYELGQTSVKDLPIAPYFYEPLYESMGAVFLSSLCTIFYCILLASYLQICWAVCQPVTVVCDLSGTDIYWRTQLGDVKPLGVASVTSEAVFQFWPSAFSQPAWQPYEGPSLLYDSLATNWNFLPRGSR